MRSRLVAFLALAASLTSAAFAMPRLATPVHLAADAKQKPLVYVSTGWFLSGGGRLVANAFSLDANGAGSPVVALAGANIGLGEQPKSVAVAPDGTVALTAVPDSFTQINDVAVFPPGANGDALRSATIRCGGTDQPVALGYDEIGNLYVASFFLPRSGKTDSIAVFPPGSNGCVSGNQVIQGSNTGLSGDIGGIAVSKGTIYVSYFNQVVEFPTTASGNVAPKRVLSGPETLMQYVEGVAIGPMGEIVVADYYSNAILVYKRTAHGDPAPIRVISGSLIGLNNPWGVAVSKDGRIFVANYRGNSISVYAPGASGNVMPVQMIPGGDGNPQSMIGNPQGLAIGP